MTIDSGTIGTLVGLATLIGFLLKGFSTLAKLKRELETKINEVNLRVTGVVHEQSLKAQEVEFLNDRMVLSLKGTEELVQHLRTRTKNDAEKLEVRIEQLEGFLSKTTSFESRRNY